MLIVEDLRNRTRHWIRQTEGPPGRYNFGPGLVIMKFGEQLRTSVIKEYQWYYIAYDALKAQLKGFKDGGWSQEQEMCFVKTLEVELDKVYDKQKLKAQEIGRRIDSADSEVKEVVDRLENRRPAGREGPVEDDDGPTEEEFMLLEEDLSDIIADVHDLAKFVQLNYTGFQKIIKKHDVRFTCSR